MDGSGRGSGSGSGAACPGVCDRARGSGGNEDTTLREVAASRRRRTQLGRHTGAPDGGALGRGARLAQGRFEITGRLGEGGMGVVYAALDRHRCCPVAIKTMHATTPVALRRLRGEFLALHDLTHRNLVSLGELIDDGDLAYFTMELVDGVDFLEHVRPGGALDPARLRAATRQLVEALAFLHAAGVVHRDVKPSNVLVADGRVVLLDFGLALTADQHGDETGGTLGYMAPEQLGRARVTPAADWYALGVILWEALTGLPPYVGDTHAILAAKRRGPPGLDAEPADLAHLAVALLDPDPACRPSDEDVARALGTVAPAAPPRAAFVGRRRELAALEEAWAASRARVVRVLVRGPSRVGKTMLLRELAAAIRRQGGLVLDGRCYARMAVPYGALHGVAAALARHLRADAAARAAVLALPDAGLLAGAFPALAEVRELLDAARAAPEGVEPAELRGRAGDALRAAIRTLAASRPLALVIDDLQWADRDGLELLERVTSGDGAPLLLVTAARDGALPEAAAWIGGDAELAVGPLLPCDAAALSRALAPAAEPPEVQFPAPPEHRWPISAPAHGRHLGPS
jgi:predicted Ser/Thr protein kinase